MSPGTSAPIGPKPSISILIVDDHPLIWEIVKSTMTREPHFDVVGEAVGGLEAVDKAEKLKPDVAVLNITRPVLDGFEAARRIRQKLPQTAIVILSSDVDKRFIAEAKKVGARAYVPKSEAAVKNDEFFAVE